MQYHEVNLSHGYTCLLLSRIRWLGETVWFPSFPHPSIASLKPCHCCLLHNPCFSCLFSMCRTRLFLNSALHIALACRPAGGDYGSGRCWDLPAALAPAAWQGQGNGASVPSLPCVFKPWQAAEGLEHESHGRSRQHPESLQVISKML